MYRAPIFDMATAIGVKSIVEGSDLDKADPWMLDAFADFVDLCIYSETLQYFVPVSREGENPSEIKTNSFLEKFSQSKVIPLVARGYPLFCQPQLSQDEFHIYFAEFLAWLTAPHFGRVYRTKKWIALHFQQENQQEHLARIPGVTMFDYDDFDDGTQRLINGAANQVELSKAKLLYAFDGAYRYRLYSQVAGSENYYMSHPLRGSCLPDGAARVGRSGSLVPISFRDWSMYVARTLTSDEFFTAIGRIREVIQKSNIVRKSQHEITVAEVRDMASELRFPPHLNVKAVRVMNDIVNCSTFGAGLVLEDKALMLLGGCGGFAINWALNHWEGKLPASAVNLKGLKWALYWPEVESQLSKSPRRPNQFKIGPPI